MRLFTWLMAFLMASVSTVSSATSDSYTDGLYWMKPGGDWSKDKNLYNNSKPTIVFVHDMCNGCFGNPKYMLKYLDWQQLLPGQTMPPQFTDTSLVSDLWINKGWNFGVFKWQGYADESNTENIEVKIWSPVPIRYRGISGRYYKPGNDNVIVPSFSVQRLLTDALSPIVQDKQQLMLIGHGVGCQVAASAAIFLSAPNIPPTIYPFSGRLILLSPFATAQPLAYRASMNGLCKTISINNPNTFTAINCSAIQMLTHRSTAYLSSRDHINVETYESEIVDQSMIMNHLRHATLHLEWTPFFLQDSVKNQGITLAQTTPLLFFSSDSNPNLPTYPTATRTFDEIALLFNQTCSVTEDDSSVDPTDWLVDTVTKCTHFWLQKYTSGSTADPTLQNYLIESFSM